MEKSGAWGKTHWGAAAYVCAPHVARPWRRGAAAGAQRSLPGPLSRLVLNHMLSALGAVAAGLTPERIALALVAVASVRLLLAFVPALLHGGISLGLFRERERMATAPQSEPEEEIPDYPEAEKADFSLEALRAFDGSDSSKPLLVGCKSNIYDMAKGKDFYGKVSGRVRAVADCPARCPRRPPHLVPARPPAVY